jgi:hypothetical protein
MSGQRSKEDSSLFPLSLSLYTFFYMLSLHESFRSGGETVSSSHEFSEAE